jgi:tetratricopeptide (TPR) repeat protein
MRSIEALKEKARRHEQDEEWQPARDLYMKAIAAMDDGAHLDIGLYNRVGDILVKIGDYEGAVEHYQRATDLYLEAELPNNAIAVCKKVARHLPGRNEVYLRMGQIRASQGFIVDARENFLIYAANVEQAGDTEEALRALIEFAALAPEDTEIRLAVAQQLEQHGRNDEAIDQLVAGYRTLRGRGDEGQAAVFADRIRGLDPTSDPDTLADAVQEAGFESTSLSDHGGPDSFEASFGVVDQADESVDLPAASAGSTSPDEVAPAPDAPTIVEADFGEIVVGGSDEDSRVEVTPGPAADEAAEMELRVVEGEIPDDDDGGVFDIGGDLPLMPFGDDVGEGEDSVEESRAPELSAEGTTSEDFELEVVDAELHQDEEAVALPFLELDEEGGVTEADSPAVGSGPAADLEEETGKDAVAEVDGSMPQAPAGEWQELRAAYDPDRPDVNQAQSLVEAAFQTGDSGVLLDAYELLARALEEAGDVSRAGEVRSQIRALDPDHPGAGEAGGIEAGRESEAGGPAEARDEIAASDGGEGYVDLGSLVFGEEEQPEKTTRFQVAYQAPSGDEAADFANMLAQFKAKVAENFDASDVRAHHDLGTAYKEMGLLDEAVAEFQQALRASSDHLPTYELLGQTFMERGEHAAAVRVLERALKIPLEVEDELIGIYYYLGRAHQELGQVDDALGFFDRVFALDINFADVTSRLRELR